MKKIIIVRIREMVMGGISKTAVDLLKNLDKKKYKIVFFIERDLEENNCFLDEIPKEIDIYFLKNYESIKKIEEVSLKKKKIFFNIKYNLLREYNRYISNKKFLNFLKKNEEIKAIIDFDMGLAKNIKQYKKYKTIAWIHNSILDWGKTQKRIDSTKKILSNYKKIVCICSEMRDQLVVMDKNLSFKIKIIYNNIDLKKIKKLQLEKVDEDEKILLKEKYILTVSRLDLQQKDYLTLIKGYCKAKEKGFSDKLYIIGDGKDKERILALIKELKLENDIKLLGKKNNPYIWMKNAEFYILSSFYEGLPTVLIEALVCGKPIVASNCRTGVKEILANERNGILFEKGNIEDCCDKILEMNKKKEEFIEKLDKNLEIFNNNNYQKNLKLILESEEN